jgi:hypothetical protein
MSTKQRLGQWSRKAVFGATNNLTNNLKNVKGQVKTKYSHE